MSAVIFSEGLRPRLLFAWNYPDMAGQVGRCRWNKSLLYTAVPLPNLPDIKMIGLSVISGIQRQYTWRSWNKANGHGFVVIEESFVFMTL